MQLPKCLYNLKKLIMENNTKLKGDIKCQKRLQKKSKLNKYQQFYKHVCVKMIKKLQRAKKV